MGDTVKAVTKIFGMFDKVDDIIYEPIKLVCDVLHQPLKQIDAHNEKTKAEHAQMLEKELKQFEADLEHEKKVREMNRTVEERRLLEEINQMVSDSDLARREKMIQLEAKYRKEMALAAAELERIILSITSENRSKLFTLYQDHKIKYLEVEKAYTNSVFSNVERMKKLFPGEVGEAKSIEFMFLYLSRITEESSAFVKQLDEDLKKVIEIVDSTTVATSNLATKYLQPVAPDQLALTEKVVSYIEGN